MGATKPSRRPRIALWILLGLLALLMLVAALGLAALRTEAGARTLWQLATRALPGRLEGEFNGGTLTDGLRINNLKYSDEARKVQIDRVVVDWDWSVSPAALNIRTLHIGRLDLTLLPTPPKAPALPEQIKLPLALDVRHARIDQLNVHQGASATTVNDVRLSLSSDRVHHVFKLEQANTPYGRAQASVRLDGTRPFPIDGSIRIAGKWEDERYQLDAAISGSLAALGIKLDASGDRLAGQAQIEATPFEAVPLRRAHIDLQHVNPQLFAATAPFADLAVAADLQPVAGSGTDLTLAGPIKLGNAAPGAWDKGRLPLVSATANATLDTQHQALHGLRVQLAGDGIIEGEAVLQKKTGRLALQARKLDPHALHTALRTTQLSGPIRIDLRDGTQDIEARLEGAALALAAKARITPTVIDITNATAQASGASLEVSGKLARDAEQAYSIRGRLAGFNPAAFAARRDKAPAAQINGDFEAEGALKPELGARVQFNVHDSTYAGLPMTGGGHLRLSGKQVLDSDLQLTVAGNQAQVKGGFGAPGAQLQFNVDAPALARLGYGPSGLLQANGTLGGTLERPNVDATYRAERLAYDKYQIARLAGQAHTQGVPGRNPDARITFDLDGQGVQAPDLDLSRINASISGSYASHEITLAADGRLRGRPLALTAGAHGNLQEQANGYAWEGTLRALQNRGFPRVLLAEPLAIRASPQQLTLGPTRMTLEQAQLVLDHVRIDNQVLSTAGSVDALDVGHLLELQRELTGNAAPFKTNLVLDGLWDVTLADTARGSFEFTRRRGDIRVLEGPRESALGLGTLRLRGDLQGRDVNLDARVEATRIGNVQGTGRIGLVPVEGRLLPTAEAPLSGRIIASVPRLQTLASLAGPKIAISGSLDANLVVGGTVGAPTWSGDVEGSKLALTLFDQGVRLHDGSLQARIDNNIAELRRLEFRGGEGTLRASGRIPLDREDATLQADIVAEHLQLLANPAGRMTVSGSATASNIARELQIKGKFTVDEARFTRPEQAAPVLDDDVVIVRGTQRVARPVGRVVASEAAKPVSERPASPFAPRITIDVDLGDDFRFQGSGADLLLAGTVRVESAPGEPPHAYGTVRIASGTFEAFGAKLAIERGVLNFDGAFANPNLTIVAMRRNQDVAAGVQVTGTVKQPRLLVVSEPDVPEEEKLSWLVFGHGSNGADAGPGQAQAAAKSAALGLLNKFGGSRIAKGLGLDQLAIGTSEFGLGTQQVVSLGKEISERLTIGYEQSLASASGVVKLTYELSRHWSVVLRGGVVAGLDMFYNRRFDTGVQREIEGRQSLSENSRR